VPVDNFYEWKKTGKQPCAIALSDRRLMALAGVWENWRSPAGEWVRTFAIITTAPNELCADVRFGRSMTRRRDGRLPPPSEDPAQTRHALAGGFDNRTTGSSALFSRG